MERGNPIKAIRLVDGDASTLTALAIYEGNSDTAHTLASTEIINITDLTITCETGGDVIVDCDSDGDGDQEVFDVVFVGALPATGSVTIQFGTPWVCPKGTVPKFSAAASNRSMCLITGFITRA